MFVTILKAFRRISSLWKGKAVSTTVGQSHGVGQPNQQWADFHAQNPTLLEYTKPYRTPADLAFKWMTQGLVISNRKQAERIIFQENYFRFKAYAIPFFDKTTDKFHAGTTFDDLHVLYCADQKLRDFLLPLLAQLEVRIRATVDNVVTSVTQDPFWHINPSYFNNFSNVERALKKAQQRVEQGKQESLFTIATVITPKNRTSIDARRHSGSFRKF